MPEALEQDIPLQQLKQVTKSLNSGQFVQVRRMLAKTAPCDTALLLESSPHKIRRMLWQLVDPDVQGDVLEELSEDVRLGIIAQMAPEHIAAATEDMGHDRRSGKEAWQAMCLRHNINTLSLTIQYYTASDARGARSCSASS